MSPPLSPEQLRQLLRQQLFLETQALVDSWRELGNFLATGYWTRDPKRRKMLRFPSRTERPGLYQVARILDLERSTNVTKSRQVMESNLHIAEPIRDCLVDPHVVWIVKSVNEDMSLELLFDRMAWSIEAIPERVRMRYQIVPLESKSRIDFVARDGMAWGSTIIAAPEGPLSVQQRTPTGILLDEFGLHEKAEEIYSVALPAVQEETEFGVSYSGKLRILSKCVPDSIAIELMGDRYDEARELCIQSGGCDPRTFDDALEDAA